MLHRQALEQLDDKSHAVVLTNESRMKFVEIKQVFQQMLPELEGENFWRHQKTISPGLQEYIEALSFSYYLENNRLISYQQVQEELRTPEGDFVRSFVLSLSIRTHYLYSFYPWAYHMQTMCLAYLTLLANSCVLQSVQ